MGAGASSTDFKMKHVPIILERLNDLQLGHLDAALKGLRHLAVKVSNRKTLIEEYDIVSRLTFILENRKKSATSAVYAIDAIAASEEEIPILFEKGIIDTLMMFIKNGNE